MYDENGNVNGNGTATTNGSNGTNSAPPSPSATGPVTVPNGTNGTPVVTSRPRPNTFSPVSPNEPPQGITYYSVNAQNGYVPQNGGQMVNQQLNRMALISHVMNIKDPTWLQVEVCREFQRGQCSRNEQECKFAHPLPHVEVQNGRVIACYDSLKNRCTRGASVCKFLHPPQHLKEQVLNNGRNNFALKNYLMAQMSNAQAASFAPSIAAPNFGPLAPFGATVPTSAGTPIMPAGGLTTFNPYAPCTLNATAVYPNVMIASSPDAFGQMNGILSAGGAPQTQVQLATIEHAQKAANIRYERLDLAQNAAGKRAVLEKGGAPVFQPVTNSVNAGLQCQPFVSAYPPFPTSYVPLAFTAPAPTVPRL